MRKQTFKFSKSATDIFFDLSITKLKEIVDFHPRVCYDIGAAVLHCHLGNYHRRYSNHHGC